MIKITPPAPHSFKYLEVLWGTPYTRSFPNSGPSYTERIEPNWLEFCKREGLNPLEDVSCYKVRARLQEVQASIKKMDVPKIEPDDIYYHLAFDMCLIYLGGMKGYVGMLDWNGVECTPDTSPGLPYLKMQNGRVRAYPNKQAVLDNNLDLVMSFITDYDKYPCIDTCNPKDEFLDIADLNRGKLRTTFGASVHKILMESACFGRQNKWLVDNHERLWIKYGAVKQYGGFDRMVKSLTHEFVWDSDCSGWDRVTCLDVVYKLRACLWEGDDDDWKLFNYLADANVRPTFLNPVDGNIYRRPTGVSSGSFNTTSDNCIKHLFVIFHLLIRLSVRQNVSWSLHDLLENADFLIYSDDKTGSLNLSYWQITPEEFLEFEKDHYALYGLVIKPGSQYWSVRTTDIIDVKHSFLGSFFQWDDVYRMYTPLPRIGKISASIAMWKQDYEVGIFVAKIFALTILSKPAPRLFAKYTKFLEYIVDKFHAQMELSKLRELVGRGEAALSLVYLCLTYGFESSCFSTFFPEITLIINDYENLKFIHMNNETVSMITPIHPVPPTSGVAKGRDTLKALLARGRINANDAAYLTARTDPFHDKDINGLRGAPDGLMDPSICQFTTKTVTLRKPSFVPAGHTWKFMVHSSPILNRMSLTGCYRYGSQLFTPPDVPGGTVGHINVDFADDADIFSVFNSGEMEPLCPKLSMGRYGSRLIGCGIEIRYTGSELNNGGNLYGEMYPQYPFESATYSYQRYVGSAWVPSGNYTMVPVKYPPSDVGYITTDPRHKSWRVTDGAFMTLRMGDPGSSPHMGMPIYPLFQQGTNSPLMPLNPTNTEFSDENGGGVWDASVTGLPYSWFPSYNANAFGNVTNPGAMTTAIRAGPYQNPIWAPQELGIIVATGLHPDATFSLRVNWFIQNIPDVSETDFMSIAKMPPFRNEVIFELCSRILQTLPIMVVLAENEGGTWWDRILNALSFVAPALGLLPHPLAKAASAAIPLMVQGGKMMSAASKVPKPPPPPPKKKKVSQPQPKPKKK